MMFFHLFCLLIKYFYCGYFVGSRIILPQFLAFVKPFYFSHSYSSAIIPPPAPPSPSRGFFLSRSATACRLTPSRSAASRWLRPSDSVRANLSSFAVRTPPGVAHSSALVHPYDSAPKVSPNSSSNSSPPSARALRRRAAASSSAEVNAMLISLWGRFYFCN